MSVSEFANRVLPVPSSAGVKSVVAALIVAISHLLGGWSPSMGVLLIIIGLDIVTGICRAALQHQLSSEVSWQRGVKKFLIFVMIVLAAQLDVLTGGEGHLLRDAMIIYYAVTEGISILENTAACGVRYPDWLLTALKQLNERKAQPLPPPGA
jgi:toxin secretion/phage lysis holin